jgi:hypothetical protein
MKKDPVTNVLDTIQNIATTSSPTFSGLTLTTLGGVAIGNYLLTTDATTEWSNLTTALNAKQNTITCTLPMSIASSVVSLGYNATNLKLTTNQLNTIQDITTTSSPTFNGLTLTTLAGVAIGNYLKTTSTVASWSNLSAALAYKEELVNPDYPLYWSTAKYAGNNLTLKYSSTNLKLNGSNELDTIQNISTASSPTFSTITSSGVIKLADGSVGSPSLCFSNYTTTGILATFSSGITYLKWSVAGTERLALRDTQFYTNFTASSFWANATDNVTALGQGGNRFTAVYAVNGTIQTSDARMKNSIIPLSLGLDFINGLNPVSYKWNDTLNEGHEPVQHSRTHLGLIAQEVKQTIEDCGETLSTTDIIDNDALVDENGIDRFGIRYHALIAPMIKAIQELTARVAYLENKLCA